MRIRPVAITGFAASAPPDGLTSTSSPRPSASRRISSCGRERRRQLGDVDRPPSHAGLAAASAVDGDVGEVAHAGLVRLDAVVDAA